ncbi:MAG: DUF3623 domain-containing protein [Alphaproteobacteria bacterium]|nr:DUF3623 domain-containing protein [Alphaproteobacteria bacterium]
MIETALAVAVALFSWWFSTGVILLLNQLPRSTFAWSMAAATALAAVAIWAILETSDMTTAEGAYIGFLSGIVLWGWHELSFLTGFITGPRRELCPQGATGWHRFKLATATLITHEVAIFATLLALIALCVDAPNQTALLTFASLWLLRLSAKFNIYLGIPNLTEEFLPAHLHYLKSYFRVRPMNGLFPISVTFATVTAVLLLLPSFEPAATPFDATAALLVGSLVALGVFEHWMMVLPLPDAALWRWAMLDSRPAGSRPEPTQNATHRIDPQSMQQRPYIERKTRDGCEATALAPVLMGAK